MQKKLDDLAKKELAKHPNEGEKFNIPLDEYPRRCIEEQNR